MKTKHTLRLLSLLLALCLMLTSCGTTVGSITKGGSTALTDPTTNNTAEDTIPEPDEPAASAPAPGSYNEGVVLVKYDGELDERVLAQLDFTSAEPLYRGSTWYTVTLGDSMTTPEAVEYLRALDCFDKVDYDYVMKADAEVESIDVSSNPTYESQKKHHGTHKIPEGWEEVKKNGKHPGGSPDVIIAIIDTGVDYNHIDLRGNIWVNSAEIPDNGIDDDNNGYIDDVRGWDCVGDDNDPMDDNGHGTHVAGIAAAENNKEGGVGVAYNCTIMPIKAGNSSGYFNNSDIAEAIRYAYMNGASVINMSFGGANLSVAVEEALEDAYNTTVLVAAAGNSGLCNQLGCVMHPFAAPMYPAALSFVIGVMSTNEEGTVVSGFSNFDHYPYNRLEYEVYAVGENVYSTWPGNKYAVLNGTSMAAPTVAGIAALLRSALPDREMYSTKYLQSQIVNTGTVNPYNIFINGVDVSHSLANVYEALTQIPKPSVKLYDYYIFDDVSFSDKNNGDGVIDAGETIHVAIELYNRGGVASNVSATLDTVRNGDAGITDPYFDITSNSISLSDIGTYSVRDGGKLYRDDIVFDVENCFTVVVSENCPNDYRVDFNVHFSYENGMDGQDKTIYTDDGMQVAHFSVSSGEKLPAVFTEDTTLTADKKYIVSSDVVIPEGVTVNVDPGVIIQFYENNTGYYNTLFDSPKIINYGTLNLNGTKEDRISVAPSELFYDCVCFITNEGVLNINESNLTNVTIAKTNDIFGDYWTENSTVTNSTVYFENFEAYSGGSKGMVWGIFGVEKIERSVIHGYHPGWKVKSSTVNESAIYNYVLTDQMYDSHQASIYLRIDRIDNSVIYRAENNLWHGGSAHTSTIQIDEAYNNVFAQNDNSNEAKYYKKITLNDESVYVGNKFYGMYASHPQVLFENYVDASGNIRVDVNDTTGQNLELIYPYITNIHMENMDGEVIKTCGKEKVKFVVEFNRDMDTTKDTRLYFGTIVPYADYEIQGEYVNARQWVGYYTLKAEIENGEQKFRLSNAYSAGDNPLECVNNATMFSFTIDTTAAMSMNLQANPTDQGIELTFAQDDYDTLLGYNIYRSEEKDGNFVKLNPAILLPTDEKFLDERRIPSG